MHFTTRWKGIDMCVQSIVAVLLVALATTPPLSQAPYPAGVLDETSYAAWLDAQAGALDALDEPEDALARARHLGYRANWTMAYHCEPYVSRTVLGIASSEDARTLATHAARAQVDLQKAAAIEGLPVELQDDLDYLMGVNKAMDILAESSSGPVLPERASDATTELAVWLDDEREPVATSARLWQALVFRASGQFDRALRSLPSAVAPLSEDRAAFFSRSVRCLVHADRGEFSLATALLLKMEERCAQWFNKTADASRAELTLLWMRIGVAERDHRPLREMPRQLVADQTERTRAFLAEDLDSGLLRLHPAVPMVVDAVEEGPRGEPAGAPREDADPVSDID